MTLKELIHQCSYSPELSVPDWMIGCFRRRCISFANGESDDQTIVYWVQSRNFTIDLRLPRDHDQVPARDFADYNAKELEVLANYEGWEAESLWDGVRLNWNGGTALQVTDRWPEEAELRRVGNSMIEFAPSGAYVEDWRLQPSVPGPLVGLKLIEEYYPQTDLHFPRDGGLIFSGEYAALTIGRASSLPSDLPLPQQVANAVNDPTRLSQIFDFETSVAAGDIIQGYTVHHSTLPGRVDQPLLPNGEFEPGPESNQVRYWFSRGSQTCVWVFQIDVLEPMHEFPLSTSFSEASRTWFRREAETLTRYTGVLS